MSGAGWAPPILPHRGKHEKRRYPLWIGAVVASIVEDEPLQPVKRELGVLDDELLAARLILCNDQPHPDSRQSEAIVLVYDRDTAKHFDLSDGRWGLVLSAEPNAPVYLSMFARRSRRRDLADVLQKLAEQVRRSSWRHFRSLAARWWPDQFRRPTPPP